MATATSGTWLRSPQRVWLRRAIFQIHLWVGVALSIYCVVIGLSGSALVFGPAPLDVGVNAKASSALAAI